MPEVETKPPEKTEPASPAKKKSAFELVAFAWLALLGVFLGLTVYYLPSQGGWLGRPMGGGSVRPVLILAIAAGAGGLFVLRKLFADRLAWAKPGQGTWARAVAYSATTAMGLFAAVSLYRWMFREAGDESRWMETVFTMSLPDKLGGVLKIRPMLFPAAFVTLLVGAVSHLLYGKPAWADFLIETESELRKVSWPPKHEWIGSSTVVILVVAIVSCFLWVSDELLSWVMKKVNLGF